MAATWGDAGALVTHALLAVGGGMALSSRAHAQQPGLPPNIQQGLIQWRAEHGSTWEVILDEETQYGRLLFNGSSDNGFQPENTEDWFLLARALLMDAYGVLGIDDDTLVDDRVLLLPLGIVGTSDKTSVRFRQEVTGVPVTRGSVSLLFDTVDKVLALDSDALPHLSGFDVTPTVASTEAVTIASASFLVDTGMQPTLVGTPRLAIFQRTTAGQRSGVLVWEVEVFAEDSLGVSAAYLYRVSAKLPATVVDREDLIYSALPQQAQTIQGKVEAYVVIDPQHRPDPRDGTLLELRPMAYMHVKNSSGGILATTDANGEFGLPGGLAPITVKMDFKGRYALTCNGSASPAYCTSCGQNFVKTVTLSAGYTTVVMNSTYDEEVVAQANCLYLTNRMRDWIRLINSMDSTFDVNAPYTIRPNLPVCNHGSTEPCPAGGRIVLSKHVGDDPDACENFAFSTLVWHETGHIMNRIYGNGNHVGSGFGEGCADLWAMYLADYHRVAQGVPGSRTGTNTTLFCGDCDRGFPPPPSCTDCQGCHGGAHADGQVLMGALWKVRDQLKTFLGDPALGASTADALFLCWMNAFDTGRIQSIIEYQWLILDAMNGMVAQAPHLTPIDAGFQLQGFPGLQMPPLRYVCQ